MGLGCKLRGLWAELFSLRFPTSVSMISTVLESIGSFFGLGFSTIGCCSSQVYSVRVKDMCGYLLKKCTQSELIVFVYFFDLSIS